MLAANLKPRETLRARYDMNSILKGVQKPNNRGEGVFKGVILMTFIQKCHRNLENAFSISKKLFFIRNYEFRNKFTYYVALIFK